MALQDSLLKRQTRSRAKAMLERALPQYYLQPNGISIETLTDIAGDLGVTRVVKKPLQTDQDDRVDAMLIPLGDHYVIALNELTQRSRQTYSLAHEIGHLVVFQDGKFKSGMECAVRYRNGSRQNGNVDEERLCEAIAAELLMPTELFEKEVRNLGYTLRNIPILSKVFNTSITSTAIKFWEVIREPCILIRWYIDAKREFALRPSWTLRNDVSGPQPQLSVMSKGSKNEVAFRGAAAAWHSSEMKNSFESLLTFAKVGRTRYATFPEYRAESIGFGMNSNRFVLSAVYLNDRKD